MPLGVVQDVAKVFQWEIFFQGIPRGVVQSFKPGEIMLETVEHGAGNHIIKTHGQIKFAPAELTMLIPHNEAGNEILRLIYRGQDPLIGGGLPPSLLKRNYTLHRRDYSGIIDSGIIEVQGGYFQSQDPSELSYTSSENWMIKAMMEYDRLNILSPS